MLELWRDNLLLISGFGFVVVGIFFFSQRSFYGQSKGQMEVVSLFCTVICCIPQLWFCFYLCDVHRKKRAQRGRQRGPRCCVTPKMLGNPASKWVTCAVMNVDSGAQMWTQAATVYLYIICTTIHKAMILCALLFVCTLAFLNKLTGLQWAGGVIQKQKLLNSESSRGFKPAVIAAYYTTEQSQDAHTDTYTLSVGKPLP